MSGKEYDNVISNIIKTLSGMVFPVLIFVYSSRVLGAESVGKVAFSRAVISYFALVASLGIKNYGIREAARLKDEKKSLRILYWELLSIAACATFLAFLLFGIVYFRIEFLKDYHKLLLVSAPTILLAGLNTEWLYQGTERYRVISTIAVVMQAISIAIMLLFVRNDSSVIAYAIVVLISVNGYSLVAQVICLREYGFPAIKSIRPRRHLGPVLWLFAYALSVELYSVLDTTMLGFIKGDFEVGLYTTSMRVCKMPIELINSIAIALSPRIISLIKAKDMKEVSDTVQRNYNVEMMLIIPVFIGIFLLGEDIIVLFLGEEFSGVGSTVRILSLIIVIIAHSGFVVRQVLIPFNQEKLILVATTAAAIINVIANGVMIPLYGRIGAAIATVLAEVVASAVMTFRAIKLVSFRGAYRGFYQYIIASVPIFLLNRTLGAIITHTGAIIILTMVFSVFFYILLLSLMNNRYIDIVTDLIKVNGRRKKKDE